MIETGLPTSMPTSSAARTNSFSTVLPSPFNADKTLAFQMSQFEEKRRPSRHGSASAWLGSASRADVKIPEREEADYRACMLGLRDYVNKNGFKNVVLGLSGGIDSAICAALAVDALGEERLRAVMMPIATPRRIR